METYQNVIDYACKLVQLTLIMLSTNIVVLNDTQFPNATE